VQRGPDPPLLRQRRPVLGQHGSPLRVRDPQRGLPHGGEPDQLLAGAYGRLLGVLRRLQLRRGCRLGLLRLPLGETGPVLSGTRDPPRVEQPHHVLMLAPHQLVDDAEPVHDVARTGGLDQHVDPGEVAAHVARLGDLVDPVTGR
jgi:hypothetical protein